MDDSIFMEMLYGEDNLGYVELRFVLFKVHLIIQYLSKISSRHILENKDVAGLLAKRERSLHKVISCYFFEYLVLIFNGL